MKNTRRYLFLFVVVMMFFVIASSGCGGSSGGGLSNQGQNTPGSDKEAREPATVAEKILDPNGGMDSDGDGKPDFLDFDGVPQLHVNNSSTSVSAASLAKLTVPSMIWMKELRLQSYGANEFSVELEQGKEYTVEFSKNFTEILGAVLPEIKIYDPDNAQLAEIEAETLKDVKIVAYPEESPSLICYTFKAPVSGSYLIRVCDANPTTLDVDAEEAEANLDEYDEIDTASVIFIYEERRNEKGEAGYYTRFKYGLEDGSKTETSIHIRDIIQLRKIFLEANPNFFKSVYGHDMEDNLSGYIDVINFIINEDEDYNYYLNRVQRGMGVVPIEEEIDEDFENSGFKAAVSPYSKKTEKKIIKIDTPYTGLDPFIEGIPYDHSYSLGTGFMAVTNLKPYRAVEFNADLDELIKPRKGKNEISYSTEYYTDFVSTQEEAEHRSKASTNVSLAKNALGASLGTGSSHNYKFGLTSTTLVVHYEEVENQYRRLNNKDFLEIAEDEGILRYAQTATPEQFRSRYGDYYVAGYQYGGCFDAYISITTETSETLDKVKKELGLSLNLSKLSAPTKTAGAEASFVAAANNTHAQELLKTYKKKGNIQEKYAYYKSLNDTDKEALQGLLKDSYSTLKEWRKISAFIERDKQETQVEELTEQHPLYVKWMSFETMQEKYAYYDSLSDADQNTVYALLNKFANNGKSDGDFTKLVAYIAQVKTNPTMKAAFDKWGTLKTMQEKYDYWKTLSENQQKEMWNRLLTASEQKYINDAKAGLVKDPSTEDNENFKKWQTLKTPKEKRDFWQTLTEEKQLELWKLLEKYSMFDDLLDLSESIATGDEKTQSEQKKEKIEEEQKLDPKDEKSVDEKTEKVKHQVELLNKWKACEDSDKKYEYFKGLSKEDKESLWEVLEHSDQIEMAKYITGIKKIAEKEPPEENELLKTWKSFKNKTSKYEYWDSLSEENKKTLWDLLDASEQLELAQHIAGMKKRDTVAKQVEEDKKDIDGEKTKDEEKSHTKKPASTEPPADDKIVFGMSSETEDILKKYNAKISIRVVTNGMGTGPLALSSSES